MDAGEVRDPVAGAGGERSTGPADTVEALLEEAADAHVRARSAAAKVVIGFRVGAEVDAVGRAIARFERSHDPTDDVERARNLLMRARRVANEARSEQRRNRQRATQAMAAMAVSRRH
jgi:hypothetical protein